MHFRTVDTLSAMIERERGFWAPLGVTPRTHPAEVVAIVDRLPRAGRWRGYGLLFGYPNYAVEFFHVPTASATEGQFTRAVPLGHIEHDEERRIRSRAAAILAAYRAAAPRIVESESPWRHVQRLNREFDARSPATPAHAPVTPAAVGAGWSTLP